MAGGGEVDKRKIKGAFLPAFGNEPHICYCAAEGITALIQSGDRQKLEKISEDTKLKVRDIPICKGNQ